VLLVDAISARVEGSCSNLGELNATFFGDSEIISETDLCRRTPDDTLVLIRVGASKSAGAVRVSMGVGAGLAGVAGLSTSDVVACKFSLDGMPMFGVETLAGGSLCAGASRKAMAACSSSLLI